MIPKYDDFLRNPGSSWDFVVWLRKFLEDDFDGTSNLRSSTTPHGLIVVLDGQGTALTTGVKGDVRIDFPCAITEWTLLADQSGSIVVDIWKDVYANYPPNVSDTITASAKPTLSSTDHNTSTLLTGWTTSVLEGDTLRFHIDSASTVTRVTLVLKLVS